MASGTFNLERNYSLYTVPAAWLLSVVPHIISIGLSNNKFDNLKPRDLNKSIEHDQSIDKATKEQIFRSSSASANGLENIGLYASAIVAGNMAGLSPTLLNRLSLGYVTSRVVYNAIYIRQTTPAAGNLRSAVFWVGIGIISTLFVMSGKALNRVARL